MIATGNPSAATDAPEPHLAGALASATARTVGALLSELGVTGTAVLLAVGALMLTVKSKKFRAAEWRAFRWGCRRTWRLIRAAVDMARGIRTLRATPEERRLIRRLAPEHWRSHADGRGLSGTLTSRPKLTDAGITCAVRLDGTWTAHKLDQAEEHVRSLLGCRTALRIEVSTGRRGGWAELTLRTRSAVDTADMRWRPGCKGIGLDTVTGKPVELALANRLLLAGSAGAGKSVTLRPLLAELSADPLSAVVMVDLKRVEGALWRSRARIARTPAEVEEVAEELSAEMMARLEDMESTGRATWTPSAARPRVVVVVDEGAEVSAVAKDAVPALESLARMGRAAEIHLWWCTQKPTMSGASAGIPAQVAAQMDVRLCLRVATATEVRTVLGEDATAEGWDAHRLPKPGVLLLRGTGRGPAPVKVWFMDDAAVRGLPAVPVWRGPSSAMSAAPRLSLAKPPAEPAADDKLLAALADGAEQVPQMVEATGLSRATVNRVLSVLLAAGKVRRVARGRYAMGAEEATA